MNNKFIAINCSYERSDLIVIYIVRSSPSYLRLRSLFFQGQCGCSAQSNFVPFVRYAESYLSRCGIYKLDGIIAVSNIRR